MNVPAQALQARSEEPDRATRLYRLYALWAGPVAWFVQLCIGYWLASWPCFPHDRRLLSPLAKASWSMDVMVALLILGVLIALIAALLSWRRFAAMRSAVSDAARPALGRACFFALWGVVWNIGFAVATLITAVAYITLPRCGG